MSLLLQSKTSDYKPHPEGIYPAVCVDVIDLGPMKTEFQGQIRMTNKVRLFFETELRTDDGKGWIVAKTLTASLNPKSRLSEFPGKWRGRPVVPGESVDLERIIGASCTLVISHQTSVTGRLYAAIDAISKPTKKVVPSGQYDPVLARQRIAEWKAKEMQNGPSRPGQGYGMQNGNYGGATRQRGERGWQSLRPAGGAFPQATPIAEEELPAGLRMTGEARGAAVPVCGAPGQGSAGQQAPAAAADADDVGF
jgi:hypothetical protein